jgi:hypothetical protein
MTHSVRPLETIYKGFRFRSRLEARWAVFFDQCGEQWIYEDQGYLLPSGPYLPDFLITWRSGSRHSTFLEVKPLTSLPTRCFEFGSGVRSAPIDDQFPLEIIKMWELIQSINGGRPLGPQLSTGGVVYGDPYDVVTGGTLVFVFNKVFAEPEVFRQYAREAIAARSARFEHNERWRHQSV